MHRIYICKRKFCPLLQEALKKDFYLRNVIWRDFESNPLIRREIDNALSYIKKTIDNRLLEFIKYEINPFSYEIDFYYIVTHDDDYHNSL